MDWVTKRVSENFLMDMYKIYQFLLRKNFYPRRGNCIWCRARCITKKKKNSLIEVYRIKGKPLIKSDTWRKAQCESWWSYTALYLYVYILSHYKPMTDGRSDTPKDCKMRVSVDEKTSTQRALIKREIKVWTYIYDAKYMYIIYNDSMKFVAVRVYEEKWFFFG